MSAYPPPIPLPLPSIFNPSYFSNNDSALTVAAADARYLKLSGGTEQGLVQFNAGLSSAGVITVSNTTQSTNATTGAVIISGGVGIGKDLHVNADVHLNAVGSRVQLTGANSHIDLDNTAASTSASTGAIRCAGGAYLGASSLLDAGNLTITNGAVISTANGTAANPSFSVGGVSCGMYAGGTNILNFSTGGTQRFQVQNSFISSSVKLLFSTNGTAGAPVICFNNDAGNDTGLYLIGADNIGFSAGAGLVYDYNTTGLTMAGNKALMFVAPTFPTKKVTMSGADMNYNLSVSFPNNYTIDTVGETFVLASATQTLTNKTIRLVAGLVGTPSLQFAESGNDTGLYGVSDGNLGIAANGVNVGTFNSSGLTTTAFGGATGKKIRWMDQGLSSAIATINSGNGTGSVSVSFNTSAPTTSGMFVTCMPTVGVNLDKLTYSAYSYTTGGFTIAVANPSASTSTSIQFTWSAYVFV